MGDRRAVVLLSGGLDSATTLGWAKREGYLCYALSVDYGQRHVCELELARLQARSQGVEEHRVVSLAFDFQGASSLTDATQKVPNPVDEQGIGGEIPSTYVPARNTLLLSMALAWAEILAADAILIGANAVDYSGYPDCRPEFLEAFEVMAQLATKMGLEEGRPRVLSPLLTMKKHEIIELSATLAVDLGDTISCYDPDRNGRPCGRCESCLLRARGFAAAGRKDPGRFFE